MIFNLFPAVPIILLLLYPLLFNSLTVSAIMYLLINIVGFCIFLYSTWYMKEDKKRVLFMIYLVLFTLSMNLLTVAKDYITFFIGWEGVGLMSFLLIGFWFEDKENLRKAKQAFMLTKLTDIGFIIGAAYLTYNNINFMELPYKYSTSGYTHSVPGYIIVLMFLPCIGKSALFPLFIWLPNAMAAPTPVSAYLHSATMVAAGVFYLTKFYHFFSDLFLSTSFFNPPYPPNAHPFVLFLLIGYFISAISAILQSDIKKLLAFSTISHLCLMYMGFFAAPSTEQDVVPFLHLILHAFTKAPLFLIAGILIHNYHTQDIHTLRGVLYKNNALKLILFILILSLSGFPFIGTFWSKYEILQKLNESFRSEFFSILIIIFSNIYCARFYWLLTVKSTDGQKSNISYGKIPLIAIVILSSFLLIFTLFLPIPTIFSGYNHRILPSLIIESLVIIVVFSATRFFLNSIEKIIKQISRLGKYIEFERAYYHILQVPTQFIQFLCRTTVEELWDEFINKFMTSDFVKFVYALYRFFYNGLIYNYLIIILVALLVFFFLLTGNGIS